MTSAIRASLLNASGQPEIRCGDETELTLRVEADVAPESIHVSLAPLFAEPASQGRLTVGLPEGWTAAYDETLAAWELRPTEPATGPCTASFGRLHPSVPVGHAVLPLVVTARARTTRTTLALHVLPPDQADKPALFTVLDAQLAGPGASAPVVAVSRRADEVLRSDLRLTLTNRPHGSLVGGSWGPWPPTLTLVFPTAEAPPGNGKLTTPRRLDDIEVVLERGAGWRVVKRRPGPEWDIVAVPVGGRLEVLDAGERLELSLLGLTTDFAPGPFEVQLRSHGFPGFADDICSFTLHKRATPMRVSKPLTVVTAATAGVAELSWRVEHASHVQLSGVGEVPPAADRFPVPVARTTTFQLTAFDALLGAVMVEQCVVESGTPPAGALPRGTILAWTGGPVPDGFAPCDGSVPDVPKLCGRFIRGADDAAELGELGGGESHRHDEVHARIPAGLAEAGHRHEAPTGWTDATLRHGDDHVPVDSGTLLEPSEAERHEHAVRELDVAIEFADAPAPRPPWHTLAYIMKR